MLRVNALAAIVVVLGGVVLILPGCAAPSGGSSRSEPLPSLREIRRKESLPREEVHGLNQQPTQRTPLMVERLDFPLSASLDEAWTLLDTSGLSPATSGAWRVNGIRVGVFSQSKRQDFAQSLPEARGGNAQIVVPARLALPLVQSPMLEHPIRVDLTVPPRPVREVVLPPVAGARVQLLVEVQRDAMGRPILMLTPHYHVPQVSLVARSAEEKQLDGHLLRDLSLPLRLERDQVLVLGLEIPPDAGWLTPTEPKSDPPRPGVQQAQPRPPTDSAQPEASAPMPTPSESSPRPPAPPVEDRLGLNLGRALFAATRYGQPIQMMFLVRLAE